MLINLSPADLDAFISVAETGSFRQSAEVLRVSQPTISARIRHLEDVLKVKLFHRTTRRVVITEAGERLRVRVERMILETRSLLTEFREEANLQRGRLVVGASSSVAAACVPQAISEFHRHWPDIEISLLDDFYGQALDRLRDGAVDLAVCPFVADDDAFRYELLFEDVFFLAVPEGHALAGRDSVTAADFASDPLIVMPPESAAWATLRAAFTKAGRPFQPAYLPRYSLTQIALVRAGLGVGLVSGLSTEALDLRGVRVLPVADMDLTRRIGVVSPRDREPSPAADAFRAHLIKFVRAHPPLAGRV